MSIGTLTIGLLLTSLIARFAWEWGFLSSICFFTAPARTAYPGDSKESKGPLEKLGQNSKQALHEARGQIKAVLALSDSGESKGTEEREDQREAA